MEDHFLSISKTKATCSSNLTLPHNEIRRLFLLQITGTSALCKAVLHRFQVPQNCIMSVETRDFAFSPVLQQDAINHV